MHFNKKLEPGVSRPWASAALFVFAFLVAVAFVPQFVDTSTVPRWCVMAIGAPLLLMVFSSEIPAPLQGHGALTLGCLSIGLLWTPDILSGLDDLAHLYVLVAVFLLGAAIPDLTPAWRGFAVGVTVSTGVALAQRLGWHELPQAAIPGGLFANRNVLAEAALVALVASKTDLRYAIGPAAAIVLAGSRNVLGVVLVLAALMLWEKNRRAALVLLVPTFLAVALMFGLGVPGAAERSDVWFQVVPQFKVFGWGIGSFAGLNPYWEFAHSEPIQLVFEHGLLAIPLFYLVWTMWRPTSHEPEQLVLGAVILAGLVAFPLRMPATAFCVALAAGHLARSWAALRRRDLQRAVPGGAHVQRGNDARLGSCTPLR